MTCPSSSSYPPPPRKHSRSGGSASGPPLGHAALDLLDQAKAGLAQAASVRTARERYIAAHLAALRAGAAVLAARAGPRRRRSSRGPRNVWTVLAEVAPELGEWAAFFAASASKRAAAEAGLPGAVTAREADDLLRETEAFLGLVTALLGLPPVASAPPVPPPSDEDGEPPPSTGPSGPTSP